MHSFLFFLAPFVSSALAYQVTRPSAASGWSNQGAQTIAWDRVSTDPDTFAIVLTNVNRDLFATDIVLASSVNGAQSSSLTIDAPNGGWPAPGGSYRVNLVRSNRELTAILAQSTEFNITSSSSSLQSTATRSTSVSVQSLASTSATGTRSSVAASSNTIDEGATETSDMVAPGSAFAVRASVAGTVAFVGAVAFGNVLL